MSLKITDKGCGSVLVFNHCPSNDYDVLECRPLLQEYSTKTNGRTGSIRIDLRQMPELIQLFQAYLEWKNDRSLPHKLFQL